MLWLLKYWRFLSIGVLVAVSVFFIWHYKSLVAQNLQLTQEINKANATVKQLDRKILSESQITTNTNTLLDEVHNAPETDDAPVAPVLDRTLDRIDELHEHTRP